MCPDMSYRKFVSIASKKRHKAAEVLMYGLLGEAFTLEEMAESRGLGLSISQSQKMPIDLYSSRLRLRY